MESAIEIKENRQYNFLLHDASIASYKLLSVRNDDYLILGVGKFRQSIFQCKKSSDQLQLLVQHNLTNCVVNAVLSPDGKMLLIVEKKSDNPFTIADQFNIICILFDDSANMVYPVSSYFKEEPKVEWLSPKCFLVNTNADELEAWEIACSRVKFNLVRKKQYDDVSCWNVIDGNLMYATSFENEGKNILFTTQQPKLIKYYNDNSKVVIDLPNPSSKHIQTLMLETKADQTIILLLEDESIEIIFSSSGALLKSDIRGVSLKGYSLQKYVYLCSEFLFLCLPTNELLCVLFGDSGIRSCFRIKISEQIKSYEMLLNSDFLGIDCLNGIQYHFDFNLNVIIEFYPHLFTHFLHYYYTKDQSDSIFKLLNYDILKFHWDGIIFDEFFLLLILNKQFHSLNDSNLIKVISNDINSFCIPIKSKGEKISSIKYKKYNIIQNWKSMLLMEKYQKIFTQNFCSQMAKYVLQIPIHHVPLHLKTSAIFQILSLYFKFGGTFCDSPIFRFLKGEFPEEYTDYWEYYNMFPIGYQYNSSENFLSSSLFKDKSTQKAWWSYRTDLKKCEIYKRESMINMTAHIFYSIENLCQNRQLKKKIPPYFTNLYSN